MKQKHKFGITHFLNQFEKNTIRLDTLRFKESNGIKFVKIWTSNNPGFL